MLPFPFRVPLPVARSRGGVKPNGTSHTDQTTCKHVQGNASLCGSLHVAYVHTRILVDEQAACFVISGFSGGASGGVLGVFGTVFPTVLPLFSSQVFKEKPIETY